MPVLGEVGCLGEAIATASSKILRLLYTIIYGESERLNRRKLREFPGFRFKQDSEKHEEKVKEVVKIMTATDLITVCSFLRVKYDGTVQEVARRVCDALIDFNLIGDDDVEEEEDETYNDEAEDEENETNRSEASETNRCEVNVTNRRNKTNRREEEDANRTENVNRVVIEDSADRSKFVLSFRDVEETIRIFNGKDDYPVERWIEDFEDNAVVLGWNDIQKLVFAKRSLEGLAKLFIQSERGISTWVELKKRLRSEFATVTNSADLHKILIQRKIKKNESVEEYFLAMKEIASRGCIENEALFQCHRWNRR